MAEALQQESRSQEVIWAPQPGPQLAAMEAKWCYEMLYGGARGGGKSIYMLLDFLQDVREYGSAWQGIYVRKTYPELRQMIRDAYRIYPQTGATYHKQDKVWEWPNGATLAFRNLERWEDAQSYQGHWYTWLGLGEAGNYPSPDVYFAMLATVRAGGGACPVTRVRLEANPGGPGHHWLKQRFVDPAPPYTPIRDGQEVRERLFIPAKVSDNRILLERDPHYIENLKKQASPELVRAWLHGDWDVQVASFFPEFRRDLHVIRPFKVPEHWTRFRSFDWGSSHPFAVYWWAISDGVPYRDIDGRIMYLPRGSLIAYREWYGMAENRPNVGIRLRNEDICKGIVSRTDNSERIRLTVTDSLPFQDRGGPKMAEVFSRNGVPLKLGDTSRVPGWQQLRSRLQGNENGPLIYFVDSCIHAIRTLPALQSDRLHIEDVDDEGEDHAADAIRLACMERQIARDESKSLQGKMIEEMTIRELIEHDRRTRDEA